MNNFSLAYLDLLRLQVSDEIDFLLRNGHDQQFIGNPCPFCYRGRNNNWQCNRLRELRQFQSQIEVQRAEQVNADRRRIGYEAETTLESNLIPLSKPVLQPIDLPF